MKSKFIMFGLFVLLGSSVFWWKREVIFQTTSSRLTTSQAKRTDGIAARDTAARIERAKADPRLAPVFTHPLGSAPFSVIKALRAEDEPVLLEAYQGTTNLLERYSLTMALAFAGGDATVAAFKHTLTDEFKGRQITARMYSETTDETEMMFTTVEALGLMAARNETAFSLLREGTDPWFWQQSVGWKSHRGPDDYGILTYKAIKAVGMSGRKEMPDILDGLTKQPLENSPDPDNWKRTFNGAVVVAAFHYAFVRDRGREAFLEWYYCAPDEDTFPNNGEYSKWKTTPEAKKWIEWSNKFRAETLARRKAANRWP